MAEQASGRVCALRNFDKLIVDQDCTVIVGAPGIGKSTRLNELSSKEKCDVIRTIEDISNTRPDKTIVIDDFYELFKLYLTADKEDRLAFKKAVDRRLEAEGSTHLCTTPYRLRWILEHHREKFNDLFGKLVNWTVETICVDSDDAEAFLDRELDRSVSVERFEKDIEWRYHFDETFENCLREGECFDEIFEGMNEYRTLVPGVLIGTEPNAIKQAVSNRESALQTVKWMLKDVSASEAISQGSSLIDGAREYAKTLKTENKIDSLRDAIGSVVPESMANVPTEKLIAGTVGAVLSPPILAVGCIGYWAWATREQNEETRKTVREEFQTVFGTDVLELHPADRENLEAEFGLEPRTLLYLNKAVSGVGWRELDRTIEELETTIDRVNEMEEMLDRHEEMIKILVKRLKLTSGTQGYMTVWEFEDDLYDFPDYVRPNCEIRDNRENDPFGLTDSEKKRGEDALVELLEIAKADEPSVTTVVGESGIGKSRLLAETGRELQTHEDIETWYVRNPREFIEPLYANDTVVIFLDEVGKMDEAKKFFELTSENWRKFGVDCTIHVVAAYRPVYEDEIETTAIPETVDRNKIELNSLDKAATISLLKDTGISKETAREIYETTNGNPLLSRLLAAAEQTENDGSQSPEKKIRGLIQEKILREADLLESDTEKVQGLLKAIAILDTYDSGEAREAVIKCCELGGDRKHNQLLKDLQRTNYINTEIKERESAGPVYSHKVDVFAEWLRLRAIGSKENDWYNDLLAECPVSTLPGIARGLIELRKTALKRFDFFPKEEVKAITRDRLESVGREAVQADEAIADVLETMAYIVAVAPNVIPFTELEELYVNSDMDSDSSDILLLFITVLYRQAVKTTKAEHTSAKAEHAGVNVDWPSLPAVSLLENARSWLKHLDELAESRSDNDRIHFMLAGALANGTKYEGKMAQYEKVQTHLNRLEDLVEDNPDNEEIHSAFATALHSAHLFEGKVSVKDSQAHLDRLESLSNNSDYYRVHLTLANALVNAVANEGQAGELKDMQTHLNNLKILIKDNPADTQIQIAFAKALKNASMYEVEVGEFQNVQAHLNDLETLTKENPDNTQIHIAFTEALYSVGRYWGEEGKLEEMQTCLDRLETLAKDNPDNTQIYRTLAQALKNAATYRGEIGEFQNVQTYLSRLETLAKDNQDNKIQQALAGALNNITVYESDLGEFQNVLKRLDRLETLAKDNPDDNNINESVSISYILAIRRSVDQEKFEITAEAIEMLDELTLSLHRLQFGERGSVARKMLVATGDDLLTNGRIDLLESLLDALQTGLSEARLNITWTDLERTAIEHLQEGKITEEMYTRVAILCDY